LTPNIKVGATYVKIRGKAYGEPVDDRTANRIH